MICTNISISHKSLTYLLVLQPELLLLLVPSLHVHLVHAEPLEIRAVLVQELKQDQSGVNSGRVTTGISRPLPGFFETKISVKEHIHQCCGAGADFCVGRSRSRIF